MELKTVYRHMAANSWYEKVQWCEENLHHGGHYEPSWYLRYPWIEFDDEKDYALFLLRWS
jgi:hypothetical protein